MHQPVRSKFQLTSSAKFIGIMNGKKWVNHTCIRQVSKLQHSPCSPLGIAVFEGHYLTVKAFLLLAEKYSYYTGFDINKYFEIDGIGYSLLHLAVVGMVYCDFNILTSQMQASHRRRTNKQNKTLTRICKYEHLKIIQLLFDHGIDVNIKNNFGITAFHILLMDMPENKLYLNFLPFIKQANINLNSQTIFGTTVLHDCLSVERKRTVTAKLLLGYGADMFIPDNDGILAIDHIDKSAMQSQLVANAITIRNNKNNININHDRLLTHNTSDMCDVCGKTSKVDVFENFNCVGCHSRTYCSKQCQKYDWKQNNHKKQCLDKQKELKETKILENSGENKLDLSFNVQSEISENESFYGEDYLKVVRQNAYFKAMICDREYLMSMRHHFMLLQVEKMMESRHDRYPKLESISKQYQRLHKVNFKYIGRSEARTANWRDTANIYVNNRQKLAQMLLEAPKGNGIENKFIVKIQISSSFFQEEAKITKILMAMEPDILKAESDWLIEKIVNDRYTSKHRQLDIHEEMNKQLHEKTDDLMLKWEPQRKYAHIMQHSKQGNVMLVYNRDRSYVAFITRNNSNIGNQRGKVSRGRYQNKHFDIIANMIKKKGWKKYKMYCYGYVDKENENILHILANDVLAHQRW